jgi:hypothetical protein
MLFDDPCITFESNHSAVPAVPVNWSMPYSAAILVMSSSFGTPTRCSFSELL